MAQKQQGNTRAVTPTTKAIRASGIKYNRLLESGNYDKICLSTTAQREVIFCMQKEERWIIWNIMPQRIWQ